MEGIDYRHSDGVWKYLKVRMPGKEALIDMSYTIGEHGMIFADKSKEIKSQNEERDMLVTQDMPEVFALSIEKEERIKSMWIKK